MTTTPIDESAAADRDGFTALRIKDVVQETVDAVSLVLDVPTQHADQFGYLPGQFLTLQVHIDGQDHRRCYSMSSAPGLDEHLQITVKRDRDGLVSNWLNDHAAAGAELHVAVPQGRFTMRDPQRDVVAFAGGSGITPVYSLLRSALAGPTQKVKLFYANRNRGSVIFADSLAALRQHHDGRFVLHQHADDDSGIVTAEQIREFASTVTDADFYVCGPGPFMDTVETTLLAAGVPAERLHLERFTIDTQVPADDTPTVTEEVTIEMDGRTHKLPYRAGHTIMQTARMAGLKAPSSCEIGSCGTCIAQVTEGSARLLNNEALDDDEVAEGLVVTCQALPTSRTITVVYE